MKKVSCIILDDEPLAIQLLQHYTSKLQWLEVVLATTDVYEVISFMQHKTVDLFFIDIQMPELSGIQMMELLNKNSHFIVTSAYPNFALKSYEFRVVDYLLKPISFDKFHKAVTKFLEFTKNVQEPSDSFLFVKVNGKQVRIKPDEIYHIEGLSDYIKIHLKDERLVVHDTLRDFISKLPEHDFLRVHRSYIINLKKIKLIDGNTIHHELGFVPLGETYKNDFKLWMDRL